jgi:uncharacterized membrane protein
MEQKTVVKQSRWASPVFRGAVVAGIIGILTALGFWEWVGISKDYVVNVSGAVLAFISLVLGSANDPTTKNGF